MSDQFEEALYQVNEAIEASRYMGSMELIGQLYYQKGECLEKLEYSSDDIKEVYKKASFFFDLLDLHSYKETLLKKRSI